MKTPRVVLWLAATLVAGAVVMALEMAAVRLFAPYFGYSIYVWATTICVVMAAMVAGYAIGGRLADTPKAEAHLFIAILSSAAWQLLALWTVRAVLPWLAETSEVTGVTLAALILFAPSMIALAATGPILVRLCADVATIGRAAGLVYALSTAGSMAGILATTFFLLPRLGTHATLQMLCGTSFLIGTAGLVLSFNRRALALPLAAMFVPLMLSPGLGWAEGSVWTAESPYNLVRVVQSGSQWLLQLNHPSSIHTVRDSSGIWTGYYYDYFALGPLMVPGARRALVLGMGGGGAIARCASPRPGSRSTPSRSIPGSSRPPRAGSESIPPMPACASTSWTRGASCRGTAGPTTLSSSTSTRAGRTSRSTWSRRSSSAWPGRG